MKTLGLQSTAWKTVSEGGLLIQVDQETLSMLADIYYLVEQINEYNSRLFELKMGISSALANSENFKNEIIGLINLSIDKLKPKLEELTKRLN
jgi:hypothetical protein